MGKSPREQEPRRTVDFSRWPRGDPGAPLQSLPPGPSGGPESGSQMTPPSGRGDGETYGLDQVRLQRIPLRRSYTGAPGVTNQTPLTKTSEKQAKPPHTQISIPEETQ